MSYSRFLLSFFIFSLYLGTLQFACGLENDENPEVRTVRQGNVPEADRRHKDIYKKFLTGKLVYTAPRDPHDPREPRNPPETVVLRIADLKDPLAGEFDLSQCGITGEHLSINTGYRKGKREENSRKLEIWITPRFLVAQNLDGDASHFRPIMEAWHEDKAPAAIFWTWGGWNNMDRYDCVAQPFHILGSNNLFDKFAFKRVQIRPTLDGYNDPQFTDHPWDIYSDVVWPTLSFRFSFEN